MTSLDSELGSQLAGLRDRFWSKVAVGAPTACWEWRGYRQPTGYGYWNPTRRGRNWLAHRLAYAFFQRDSRALEIGLDVCHACDNPACCNPSHLFLGTHADNMRDASMKARLPRGERKPEAKLTEAMVRALRADYGAGMSGQAMGRKYGVSHTAALEAARGITWRHVAG